MALTSHTPGGWCGLRSLHQLSVCPWRLVCGSDVGAYRCSRGGEGRGGEGREGEGRGGEENV